MFCAQLLVLSSIINNENFILNKIKYYDNRFTKTQNNLIKINQLDSDKIGIVDFRFILKRSNAMKILGKKFLSLEKEINKKIKQKQILLKNKEENIKKNKVNLSEIEYKKRIKIFKEEVFQIQKIYKEERSLLNKSFQKIQKNLKDLLAQIIKDVSIKKKFNIVLLKENVFLFNNQSIDFTDEVLELFNNKTKSMKIIITPPK